MQLLTIFSSPKPFIGEAAWNQLNALRSWRAVHPDVEIIIFGAPSGAAEAATEVNATLVPEIETSASGAPSFNAMAAWALRHSPRDLFVYANGDILLNETMLRAMQSARRRFERFLLVGERMDLAPSVKLDVREPNWVSKLLTLFEQGHLTAHGPTGADYFGFVRGMWQDLAPVFMGRGMCDQALLHYCFRKCIPVIDATLMVVNVHQHHGYQHVAEGKQQVFYGEERKMMARAHGLRHSLPTIADADWRFEGGEIVPDRWRRRFLRRVELEMRYTQRLEPMAAILRVLQYWRGRQGTLPRLFSLRTVLSAWQALEHNPI